MRHPKIYPYISDDSCPKREDFRVGREDPWQSYFITAKDDSLIGMWLLHRHNAITYEIHTCVLPSRFRAADEAAKAVVAWIFENTPCRKIITHVPSFNRAALKFALRAGLQLEGCVTESFLKDGKIYDQHLLGITKKG